MVKCPCPRGLRRPWSALVGLCASALLSQLALASTPAPYGEYFVRLGAQWPDAGVVSPSVDAATMVPGPEDASYQIQLVQLETAEGPYAAGLAEPLADMARLHRRNGDLALAQQAYQRALHLVRINEGLYSESQAPILRELLETYRLTGDMATLDERYDYFFRLYGSGKAPYTAARLDADLEYLRWQREALRLELDERDSRRLITLYSLNEELLEQAAAAVEPAVPYASYRELALSQLRNLYLLEDRYHPKIEYVGATSGAITRAPASWEEKDMQQQRLENLQRNALVQGRSVMETLIERTPEDEPELLAGAWLELGDWNQWNGRRPEALSAYRKVEQLLREAGLDELREQWLGEPVELPANGAFWQPQPQGVKPVVVQARFDVSASGRARNIEANALEPEDEGKAGRLRRNLAQVRFRPRIANGEAQAQTQLQRDYQVLD